MATKTKTKKPTLHLKESFTSRNLYEEIALLTEKHAVHMSVGLQWTTENLPNAVLVGGAAVVHYLPGGRSLTPDLDFLVESINEVKLKLDDDGIYFTDLANPQATQATSGSPLGVSVEDFNTDFIDPEMNNRILNRLVLSTPRKIHIGGVQVRVVAPELLAIMKIELGRDKDTDDAFALLMSGEATRETYLDYIGALKSTLRDYSSLRTYADLIP